MNASSTDSLAIVVIGRNEAPRLDAALASVLGRAALVVYVDSGSTDASVAIATRHGASVVTLTAPFSAAKARNVGYERVRALLPHVEFVQFLDGDCTLEPGWLEAATLELRRRPELVAVRGNLRERHPQASLYNRLCQLEWLHPAGPLQATGGIFVVRAAAFEHVGGFRAEVIAAEDDELSIRLRQAGGLLWQLDLPMATHDADLHHLSQWLQRSRRSGHAFAQVAALHGGPPERYFVRERRRIYVWAVCVPLLALVPACFTHGWSLLLLLAYVPQFLRILQHGLRRNWSANDAALYALFTLLGRFPSLIGLLDYQRRRLFQQSYTLIEHKRNRS